MSEVEIEDLRARVAQLEAELTVVTFERNQLQAERDAVRVYFGGTKVGDVLEAQSDPTSNFTDENIILSGIKNIMSVFPDQPIRAIKALRERDNIAEAWHRLGGTVNVPDLAMGRTSYYFGLKEAKDIIDAARSGYVNIPGRGKVSLI